MVTIEAGLDQNIQMEQRIPHELMHIMLARQIGADPASKLAIGGDLALGVKLQEVVLRREVGREREILALRRTVDQPLKGLAAGSPRLRLLMLLGLRSVVTS